MVRNGRWLDSIHHHSPQCLDLGNAGPASIMIVGGPDYCYGKGFTLGTAENELLYVQIQRDCFAF
jgi:hypothetical protein